MTLLSISSLLYLVVDVVAIVVVVVIGVSKGIVRNMGEYPRSLAKNLFALSISISQTTIQCKDE